MNDKYDVEQVIKRCQNSSVSEASVSKSGDVTTIHQLALQLFVDDLIITAIS